jgi:hypothetical protein
MRGETGFGLFLAIVPRMKAATPDRRQLRDPENSEE